MSAPKIVGPSDGKAGSLGSIGVRFMIGTEETHEGGFSLVEHPMPPRALAAPLHRHSREDEYSYVLAAVAVQRRRERARRHRVLHQREAAVVGLLGVDHEPHADRAEAACLAVAGTDELGSGMGRHGVRTFQ